MDRPNRLRLTALVAAAAILATLAVHEGAVADDVDALPASVAKPSLPAAPLAPAHKPKPAGWAVPGLDDLDSSVSLDAMAQLPLLTLGTDLATVYSCDAELYCRTPTKDRRCYQAEFPEVSWRFCAVDMRKRGLWIEQVALTRKPGDQPIDVIYDAGVMDLFVPYHSGDPRAYDMEYCYSDPVPNAQGTPVPETAGSCQQKLDSAWAGPNGLVEDFPSEIASSVAIELRDRGLAHLCTRPSPFVDVVRRGSEMAVWAVFDPGNYDNIIEYTFRDDGSIGFRSGVTGFNLPAQQDVGHMHNTLWRVDMDLNGHPNDTAYLWRHVESGTTAEDQDLLFNNGFESFASWDAFRFSTLVVKDGATNANGNRIGYTLQPLRTGTARHFGSDEAWTHMDFGVTRYRAGEPSMAGNDYERPNLYLLQNGKGVSNKEPIENSDLVLWHISSAHHEPHDEDRSTLDVGTSQYKGITPVHWSGFDLVPHDLFDYNPLGGPTC